MSGTGADFSSWSATLPANLETNCVHIWRGSLLSSDELLDENQQLLHPEELARAQRFKFDRHRNGFITARALLRKILGLYLRLPANEIELQSTSHGKPFIITHKLPELRFNLSHSHERVLYAFCLDRDVGIDIELIKPGYADSGIPERFFSRSEVEVLRSIAADRQAEGFFNCWTRKEAIIKAIGQGLSLPLSAFDVTLKPGGEARVLDMRIPEIDKKNWKIWDIKVDNAYKAALALQGDAVELSYFECDSIYTR